MQKIPDDSYGYIGYVFHYLFRAKTVFQMKSNCEHCCEIKYCEIAVDILCMCSTVQSLASDIVPGNTYMYMQL